MQYIYTNTPVQFNAKHYIIHGKYNTCPVVTLVNTMKNNVCTSYFLCLLCMLGTVYHSVHSSPMRNTNKRNENCEAQK